MKFKKNLKNIHLNHISKLLFNIKKIKKINISINNFTLLFTEIINKFIFFLKKVNIDINIFISNNDKRLLIREINVLSFLFNNKILFKLNKRIKKRKKISILRSTCISSKSKEHLGFNKYIINFKINVFFNLFRYLFLKNIKKFSINYSIIKLKINLI